MQAINSAGLGRLACDMLRRIDPQDQASALALLRDAMGPYDRGGHILKDAVEHHFHRQ